jgi:hypothetical protein
MTIQDINRTIEPQKGVATAPLYAEQLKIYSRS